MRILVQNIRLHMRVVMVQQEHRRNRQLSYLVCNLNRRQTHVNVQDMHLKDGLCLERMMWQKVRSFGIMKKTKHLLLNSLKSSK